MLILALVGANVCQKNYGTLAPCSMFMELNHQLGLDVVMHINEVSSNSDSAVQIVDMAYAITYVDEKLHNKTEKYTC